MKLLCILVPRSVNESLQGIHCLLVLRVDVFKPACGLMIENHRTHILFYSTALHARLGIWEYNNALCRDDALTLEAQAH